MFRLADDFEVDDFEVGQVFEDSQYERTEFKLIIEGRQYKGYYKDGQIDWLHPHPKQDIGERKVKAVEDEVLELLNEHGVRDETENLEIEPLVKNKARNLLMFKLKIQGEEYKGTFQDGELEWFHPKPRRKLNEERMKKIEEGVQKKVEEHLE